MARIKVYTMPDCSYCTMTKDWLNDRECEYDELDITTDVEHLREWRSLSGGAGVPVVAHGTDLIIGFHQGRLSQLLECCCHTSEVPGEA